MFLLIGQEVLQMHIAGSDAYLVWKERAPNWGLPGEDFEACFIVFSFIC